MFRGSRKAGRNIDDCGLVECHHEVMIWISGVPDYEPTRASTVQAGLVWKRINPNVGQMEARRTPIAGPHEIERRRYLIMLRIFIRKRKHIKPLETAFQIQLLNMEMSKSSKLPLAAPQSRYTNKSMELIPSFLGQEPYKKEDRHLYQDTNHSRPPKPCLAVPSLHCYANRIHVS